MQLTERYDREATLYRELWAPILHVAASEFLRQCASSSARHVLDVGAGVGMLLPELRAAFPVAQVIGIDRSHGMLRLAPAGFARAVMDATRLGIPPASADLVLFAFMLFHLEKPLDGLREAHRVLRPGGRVGTLTWGGDLESKATRIWTECLDAYGAAAIDPEMQTRHDFTDTPEKMASLLHEAGFHDIQARYADLAYTIGPDHLLQLRTRLGSAKPRYDSLDPRAQEACVTDARRRMQELSPGDFVAHGRVVQAMASV
jgi:ubiquinone/menaquinone biosynthesis C-methylase UbiE